MNTVGRAEPGTARGVSQSRASVGPLLEFLSLRTKSSGQSARPGPGLENKPTPSWHRQPEYAVAPYGFRSSDRSLGCQVFVYSFGWSTLRISGNTIFYPGTPGVYLARRLPAGNRMLRLARGLILRFQLCVSEILNVSSNSGHHAATLSTTNSTRVIPPRSSNSVRAAHRTLSAQTLPSFSKRWFGPMAPQSSRAASISSSTSCADAASAVISASFSRSSRPAFFRFSN